jgi:hypothetical protein
LPALQAAKAVGQRTAFFPPGNLLADALELDGSMSIAHVREKQLPSPRCSLRRVAVWSTQTRLAHAPVEDDERALSTRAALLHEYGLRLESLGQRAECLLWFLLWFLREHFATEPGQREGSLAAGLARCRAGDHRTGDDRERRSRDRGRAWSVA